MNQDKPQKLSVVSCQLLVVFFGTPEFARIILEKLLDKKSIVPARGFIASGGRCQLSIVSCVTAPDKPVGRSRKLVPSPVKELATNSYIPLLQPDKLDKLIIYKLKNLKPDLFIVAAYGNILPKEVLEIPKYGTINVHPSLLPKYRGPSPIQSAILAGDQETGVTLMLMDEKMDHGPVISNSKYQIVNSKITYPELSQKLANLGLDLLVKIIPDYISGKIKPKEQEHDKATYTKLIRKKDGKIDFKKDAFYLERMTRAFYPWPSAYTKLKIKNQKLVPSKVEGLKIIKIFKAIPRKSLKSLDLNAGTIFLTPEDKLAVACGNNTYLEIKKLQLEGKKPCEAEDFLRGHREILGKVLG